MDGLCGSGLLLVFGIIAIGYYFVQKRHGYFKERGILYAEPQFPFGSLKGAGTKIHPSLLVKKVYETFAGKDSICGLFLFVEPIYMILDPELSKHILVKDFNYFPDRGIYHNEADDPLSANMLALDGQKWKNLRGKLTPTFTTGKMKMMYDLVHQCAEELEQYLQPIAQNNEQIEIKDVLGRFSTDVIGNCAFGIECNSIKNPDAEFRYHGRRILEPPAIERIKFFFATSFPKLSRKLGIILNEKTLTNFFKNIVEETVQYRKTNLVERNDFMKLLIEMKNENVLSINEIAAQCFLFFVAGFETSSSTMSYCLLELAKNPEIQDKVRANIESITKKHSGKVTYESISEMDYLDNTINETLRKFPSLPTLMRRAADDYKVPNSEYVIEKGRLAFIPVLGMQMNPDIYPDPDKFDPDRFLPENKAKRHPFTFLPFGEGPHNCIGMRFGMMQTRLGLIHVLRKYRVVACEKTAIKLDFKPNPPFLALKDGIWVQLQMLEKGK